jgi:hypothetical protein
MPHPLDPVPVLPDDEEDAWLELDVAPPPAPLVLLEDDPPVPVEPTELATPTVPPHAAKITLTRPTPIARADIMARS